MIELNKDGLAASEGWMQHQSATFGLHWKNAKPIIEAYFDTIHESDAPALALAILEASGVEAKPSNDDPGTPGNLGRIAYQLMIHIEDAENITAEAEAQAKLEAEALELFNVVREHDGEPRVATWDGFHAGTMEVYLLLARRAREIAKEATK